MAKSRPNKVLDNIVLSNTARARKNINQWRTALQQAENVENPKRTLLYNLYSELVLDAHLTAEHQKRKLAVRGSDFSLINDNGEIDLEKTALLERPWFFDFMDHYIDTIFWGHTVIQIDDLNEDGEISNTRLVNRKHIIPEKGLFVYRESDEKGVFYREDKKFAPWLIEIGKPDDFGLLNQAAPHILIKRFSQSAWSEFTEIFGMPIRYGTTNVKDKESLNRMEQMMINMGTAAWAVIDNDEQIEFLESIKTNGDVYDNLIKRCNSELSKLINGAVIGEDTNGGSRSKEEVGERTSDMISTADKQSLEGFVNFTLLPQLINLGYPLEGLTFSFNKNKDIKGLWAIAQGLLNHYDIDEDYIEETFGIPVTKKPTPPPAGNLNTDPDFFS